MGLVVKKETVSSGVVAWINVLETASGGFTLDKTGLTDGNRLPAGLPVGYSEATRIARVVKMATLQADATNVTTTYQVKKGHNLIVGEFIARTVGGASYAITAINTSNADYDVLTLGTTLGVALVAGDGLFQSAASGAAAGAFIIAPKGLLYEEMEVNTNESLSVVLRGTIYARRAPLSNANLRSALPLILFSESY